MKKIVFIIVLAVSAFQVKAQHIYPSFINSTESQVRAFMKQKSGIVTADRLVSAYFAVPVHKELIYRLPEANSKIDDINIAQFYLGKNGLCFQYTITYRTDRFLKDVIKQYDDPANGFKRVGKELHWLKPHTDVRIFNHSNNVHFTTFLLRVLKD